MSRRPTRAARWLLAALVVLIAAALAYLLVGATDSALAVWQKLADTPKPVRVGFLVLLGIVGFVAGTIVWRLLHPRAARVPVADAIDRTRLEQRAAALPEGDAVADAMRRELAASDARRDSRRLYVALFGDISVGKSALLQALSGQPAASHVVGGTTREVRHADVVLDDGLVLDLADVPGSNEVDGEAWARIARDEAARAHALVYVGDGEPTRAQDADLRRIGRFGKPLLLALNKSDRYRDDELAQLLPRLRDRYRETVMAVLPIQAGGSERLLLEHGGEVERPRVPRVEALSDALRAIARRGPDAFEPAREQSVLASVDAALDARESELRAQRGMETVRKYTRRAVVGAMAAVAPGTDLVIQGALATAMVRELASIHGLRVRDVDLDTMLDRAGTLVRTTASVTLAIAGNALKAFPGFGTVGGGLVHAVAYGLVFDSLGRAVAETLAQARSLDRGATLSAFERALERPSRERLSMVMEIAKEALLQRGQPGSGRDD